jgi:CHAD domain-containing protein
MMKAVRAASGMVTSGCYDAYLRMTGRTLERLNADISRHFADPHDPDAVHDVRVDMRVLTSILYLFLPLIGEYGFASADAMLREAIGAFGEKREADMLAKAIKDFVLEHPEHEEEAVALIGLIRAMSIPGEEDRELIQRKLKKLGETLLSMELTDEGKEHMDFGSFAELRLSSMLEELRAGASEGFGKKRRIHRYRIAVKKALYSLELAEEWRDYGGAVWRARLKAVQDTAGSIHDAEVNIKLAGELNFEDRVFYKGFMEFLEKRIVSGRERFMFLMKEIRRMEA